MIEIWHATGRRLVPASNFQQWTVPRSKMPTCTSTAQNDGYASSIFYLSNPSSAKQGKLSSHHPPAGKAEAGVNQDQPAVRGILNLFPCRGCPGKMCLTCTVFVCSRPTTKWWWKKSFDAENLSIGLFSRPRSPAAAGPVCLKVSVDKWYYHEVDIWSEDGLLDTNLPCVPVIHMILSPCCKERLCLALSKWQQPRSLRLLFSLQGAWIQSWIITLPMSCFTASLLSSIRWPKSRLPSEMHSVVRTSGK